MEWLKSLFRQSQPTASAPVSLATMPVENTYARERAGVLAQKEWVEEQLALTPIDRLLSVSGIREAHLHTLRNAGITNLREAREVGQLPLMGSSGEWAQDWLRNHVSQLEREYRRHCQALLKASGQTTQS